MNKLWRRLRGKPERRVYIPTDQPDLPTPSRTPPQPVLGARYEEYLKGRQIKLPKDKDDFHAVYGRQEKDLVFRDP